MRITCDTQYYPSTQKSTFSTIDLPGLAWMGLSIPTGARSQSFC